MKKENEWWVEEFNKWKEKYPTKTIGHHHYIRERNIKKFINKTIEETLQRKIETIRKVIESEPSNNSYQPLVDFKAKLINILEK